MTRHPRLAALDVGSNTVHLVVASWNGERLERVTRWVAMPRAGEAVEATGRLGTDKLAEVCAAVKTAAGLARRARAELILLAATEPLRRAADADMAVVAIGRAAGVPCHVLDPATEARLSFRGATHGLDLDGEVLVTDVGGGSTEVAVGRPGGAPRVVASLPIGSGVATQRWLLSDPPRPEERAACAAGVRAVVADAPAASPAHGVATGGTATSLPRLLGRTHRSGLSPRDLDRCRDLLDSLPSVEIAERTGLEPVRVRVLTGGVEVVAALVERYRLRHLRVSRAGLREGMILAWLERGEAWHEEEGAGERA